MGSATVHELAKRGQRVLGLEQYDVPNTLGSSVGVNRIIRLAYAEHPDYVPLLRRAYERWREIERTSRDRLLIIAGGIDAGTEHSDIVIGALRACSEHRLPHETLGAADLSRRYPGYQLPSDMVAVYQPDGGFLMSERCIVVYVEAALELGAEIHGRERVLAWEAHSDTVHVRTEAATYTARALVFTAGPWTAGLLPELSPVAVPERQVLLWSQPLKPEHFGVESFPVFNMEAEEGRFYGFPVYGVPGFKIGKYHHRQQEVDPDTLERECSSADEAIMRVAIRRYFPNADGPTLAMKVCMFTNSPDEHFLVDQHPEFSNVVIAAGFSGHGFKFCSVVGEVAADLILTGATRWNIDLFRLTRPSIKAALGSPASRGDANTRPQA